MKTYFLAPTRDAPPNGRIALGNIIADISEPENSINECNPPILPSNAIYTSIATNWRSEKSRSRDRKGSVWAGFLQVLGVGGELNITRNNSQTDAYEFDKLTTTYFVPTTKYLEQAINDKDVKSWLKYNKNEPLHMITGVKIASGARFLTEIAKERGFRFQLGMNASISGIPINFGPEMDISKKQTEKESADATSDFVFAFRVKEIRYKVKTGLTHKDFVKGAMYSIGDRFAYEEDEDVEWGNFEFADDDPQEDDLDRGFEGLGSCEEDGDAVKCFIPASFSSVHESSQ